MNDFFNKEQLLELSLLKQSTEDFRMEGPTARFIIQYLVEQYPDDTEFELSHRFNYLKSEYEIQSLVDQGLLEADLGGNDIAYYASQKLRSLSEKARNARV